MMNAKCAGKFAIHRMEDICLFEVIVFLFISLLFCIRRVVVCMVGGLGGLLFV